MHTKLRIVITGVAILLACRAAAATDPTSLVQIDSKDFGDTNCVMKIVEIERSWNTSKVRMTYENLGSSVGSSMFIVRGFYEIAKARGTEYFVNLKEWNEEERSRLYLVGFTNTKDADLKKEFGEEFDYENEHGQKRLFLSVSQFKRIFERRKDRRNERRP